MGLPVTGRRYVRDRGYDMRRGPLGGWGPGPVRLLGMTATLSSVNSAFGAGRVLFALMLLRTASLLDSSQGSAQREQAAAWWGWKVETDG